MKRTVSVLMVFVVAVMFCSVAVSEEMTKYADDKFGFEYPSSWHCYTNTDGSATIVDSSTNMENGIHASAIWQNIFAITGDDEEFNAYAENCIKDYSTGQFGQFKADGSWERIDTEQLRGFRACGLWNGQLQAELIAFIGDEHLILFVFVGKKAIALEEIIIDSIELYGIIASSDDSKKYTRYDSNGYTISYPLGWTIIDTGNGILFADTTADTTDTINALGCYSYTLDYTYTDAIALYIAEEALPSSTNITAEAEIITIGERNYAMISGDTSSGPIVLCVCGSGNLCVKVMFAGEYAVTLRDDIMLSITFTE